MRTLCVGLICAVIAGAEAFGQDPPAPARPASGPAALDDPWSPGARTPEWDRVDAIQRFPVFTSDTPDWAILAKDPSPYVRATTMLGIGRTRDTGACPIVIAGLKDGSVLVRKAALWSLFRMNTPLIREPLVRVLATWADLDPIYPGKIASGWVGLKGPWTGAPVRQRRQWGDKFDMKTWMWSYTGPVSGQFGGDGASEISLCLESSYWHGKAPFSIRALVWRSEGKTPRSVQLTGERNAWYLLDRWNGLTLRTDRNPDWFEWHVKGRPASLSLEVEPDAQEDAAFVLDAPPKALKPGLYLFHTLRATCPAFVRVQRSPDFEKRIPDLLRNLANRENIVLLGKQRVRAAVPDLILAFRLNGVRETDKPQRDNGINFAVGEALARLRVPAAVPLFLDYPLLRDYDVGGTTFPYVKALAACAQPEFARRILNWRQEMGARRTKALEMSLSFVDCPAPPNVEQATLDLLKSMPDSDQDWSVRKAAIRVIESNHPDVIADALWATRHNVFAFKQLLAEMTKTRGGAKRILVSLVERAEPVRDEIPEVRRVLLKRAVNIRPELKGRLYQELLRIANDEHLRETMKAAFRGRIKKTDAAAAVEQYGRTKRGRRPHARLQLAILYYDLGRDQESDRILQDVLDGLAGPDKDIDQRHIDRVVATYYRAEILRRRGDLPAAKRLYDYLASPSLLTGSYSTPHGYLYARDLREEAAYLDLNIRVPGLQVRRLRGADRSLIADGVAFSLHQSGAFHGVNALAGATVRFPAPPCGVRAYRPVDARRVVAALENGTIVLYESGRDRPVWTRPLSLGFHTYFTASPQGITAADEAGTLRLLDPATGRAVWQRAVSGAPAKPGNAGIRGLIRQHGDILVIPNTVGRPPRRFECVEIATGKLHWRYEPGFAVDGICLGQDLLVVADWRGRVQGVSLTDGRRLWSRDVHMVTHSPVPELDLALAPSGGLVLVGVCERLSALKADTGEIAWTRDWRPRPDVGKLTDRFPRIRPAIRTTNDGIWCVIGWCPAKPLRLQQTDILRLTFGGKPVLQESAPTLTKDESPRDVYVVRDTLIFRRGRWWEMWRYPITAPTTTPPVRE